MDRPFNFFLEPNKLQLERTSRVDYSLLRLMKVHYSQPKGFVGRTIAYAIHYGQDYYGHIVAGSATKYLPNRNEFFGIDETQLVSIVNNTFFHIERFNNIYPSRNFTSQVVKEWMKRVQEDWLKKYQDEVIGFETLVELPRTGELYLKVGFKNIGVTKGYSCKRIAGRGTDSWSGKRIWNTTDLKPKNVLVRKVDGNNQ